MAGLDPKRPFRVAGSNAGPCPNGDLGPGTENLSGGNGYFG